MISNHVPVLEYDAPSWDGMQRSFRWGGGLNRGSVLSKDGVSKYETSSHHHPALSEFGTIVTEKAHRIQMRGFPQFFLPRIIKAVHGSGAVKNIIHAVMDNIEARSADSLSRQSDSEKATKNVSPSERNKGVGCS